MYTHTAACDFCNHCYSLAGYFWSLLFGSWGVCWIRLPPKHTDLVPFPTVWNHWRGRALVLSNNSDPFLIRAPVSLSSLFFVFPFSFPQGGVAFTASNYRLYQSYISPYISVDLSRHLKGQLIALWQACAWPLKEKSRSGRCKPTKHIPKHTRTHPCPSLSRLSFFVLLYHFLFFPRSLWDSFHCCVITLVISREQRRTIHVYFCLAAFCVYAHDTNDEG